MLQTTTKISSKKAKHMKPYFFARRSSGSVNGVQKNVREKREMNDFERV